MTSPNATPPASTPETPLAALQRENAALRAQLAAKPKASPRAKPRKVAAPKAKEAAKSPATDAELSASASKVMDGLGAIAKEELAGLKERGRGVAEIFLSAFEDALSGRSSSAKKRR